MQGTHTTGAGHTQQVQDTHTHNKSGAGHTHNKYKAHTHNRCRTLTHTTAAGHTYNRCRAHTHTQPVQGTQLTTGAGHDGADRLASHVD